MGKKVKQCGRCDNGEVFDMKGRQKPPSMSVMAWLRALERVPCPNGCEPQRKTGGGDDSE